MTREERKKLPKELREQLVEKRVTDMLEEALEESDVPMSVNDLLKAIWAHHGIVQKRNNIIAALHRLKSQGRVRRCGRGSWNRDLK